MCPDFCILPTPCSSVCIVWFVMCQVGRTEMIKDTLSPDFVKHFVVDYFFEESQKIRFEVLVFVLYLLYLELGKD